MSLPDESVIVGDQAAADREDVTPDPETEAAAAAAKVVDDDAAAAALAAGKEEPTLLAGKFKTVQELEKSYSELSKKIGTQGSKLGKAEEERSLLLSQLDKMSIKSQDAPKDQGKADDLEGQLSVIAQEVEDGNLSIGDGMKKTALISAQIAQNATVEGIKKEQTQATVDQSKKTFAETNPDFFDMQQSGELEGIKNTLPGFHDDISAYFALKAETLQSTTQAAVDAARLEGIGLGKAEMAKIAGGDANTQKVLQSGGKSAEAIGRKTTPMKQSEIRQSGLDALNKARGG
jgi:uncharacterized membrane-anchored protein YhcB (DUF1043 family)